MTMTTTLTPGAQPGADTVGGGADGAVASASERYLTFALGGEMFALPILDVTEILEFRNLTTVPMMPPFIRGVLNLRGRVVPVVDLSVRFGAQATAATRRTSIVIIDANARNGCAGADSAPRHVGILVDAVNKVMQLNNDDVVPPPELSAGARTDFVQGMARHNEEFIVVLNLTRLVDDDRITSVVDADPDTPQA